ncbi:hypothetical protein LTR62_001609 [Meristemomyces frigidus]|uniref:Uncharacterized protein n=1 Tax=Meristemomyces frigidus TaxID=1508187 RepID=A0AAN7TAV9_9PEZI|nr:hypothetical protein LTR62_001609 [Meristemomyces frigidus]
MASTLHCAAFALPLLLGITLAESGITVAWKTNSSLFYANSIASGRTEALALYSGCQVYNSDGSAVPNGNGDTCVQTVFEWMLYAMSVTPDGEDNVATATSGNGNVRQNISSIGTTGSLPTIRDGVRDYWRLFRRHSSNASPALDARALTLGVGTAGNYTTASFTQAAEHMVRDYVSIPNWQSFRFTGVDGLKVDAIKYGTPQSSSYESDIMAYAASFTLSEGSSMGSWLSQSDRWQYQICSESSLLVNGSIIIEEAGFGSSLEPMAAISCADAALKASAL